MTIEELCQNWRSQSRNMLDEYLAVIGKENVHEDEIDLVRTRRTIALTMEFCASELESLTKTGGEKFSDPPAGHTLAQEG